MHLSPTTGWQQFGQTEVLLELIVCSLNLSENTDGWEYYNFNETSSTWCSNEVHGTNQLQIIFDSDSKDAKIKSLVVEMTNNSGVYFLQLFKLKSQLKRQFDVQVA